jgi:hypothetical protein
MDDAYYTAQPGSEEHRAAYAKEFEAHHGIGYPSADVGESYYVDNYEEIERERYYQWLEEQHEAEQASRRELAWSWDEISAELDREPEAELPW